MKVSIQEYDAFQVKSIDVKHLRFSIEGRAKAKPKMLKSSPFVKNEPFLETF